MNYSYWFYYFRWLMVFITILLLVTLTIPQALAEAGSGTTASVHIAKMLNKNKEAAKKYIKRHPFEVSLETFSVNRTLNFNSLRAGYLAWINYSVNPDLFVRFTGAYLTRGRYSDRYLVGVTHKWGKFSPYVELEYLNEFGNGPSSDSTFYDTGVVFNFWHRVLPIMEFDDYLNRKTITLTPQVIFVLTSRYSLQLGFSQNIYNGNNGGFLRLNITI